MNRQEALFRNHYFLIPWEVTFLASNSGTFSVLISIGPFIGIHNGCPNQIHAQTPVEALACIGEAVAKLTQNQITLASDQSHLHSKLYEVISHVSNIETYSKLFTSTTNS